jgi:hypothetical protein
MPIHVALHHRSHYSYDRPVGHLPHIVRLRPAPHCRTSILSYALRILPPQHFLNWQQDPFSNYLARLLFPEKSTELLIEVDLVAEMAVHNPFDFFLEPGAEQFPFDYEPELKKQLTPFLEAAPAGPLLKEYLETIGRDQTRTAFPGRAHRRPRRADRLIRPSRGVPEETLSQRPAPVAIPAGCLSSVPPPRSRRALCLWHLIQLKPDVKSLDGPSGTDVDFTDLHAGARCFFRAPAGSGWIPLPTAAGEGHIPWPTPIVSAAPITGVVDDCEAKFTHQMRVTRIFESPRVTKPYTDEQWNEIEALGHRIDAELHGNDVRLTMGGEPTFISVDHMDGDEWNFTAVGPEKRRLSGALIRRLKNRFAPGGLLQYGQGKWYPGESLPRWALGCYWRRDGQIIWHDDSLFADEGVNYGHMENKRLVHPSTGPLISKAHPAGSEDA